MIDVVIGPGAAIMTGGTGVGVSKPGIIETMADGAAFQGVGYGVMTGRTTVMDLVVAAVGEGRSRIRMTYGTRRFYGDSASGNMINAAVNC